MESYVDRDRMIAVSIGASDIRSSILKQKGDDCDAWARHHVQLAGKKGVALEDCPFGYLALKPEVNAIFLSWAVYGHLVLHEPLCCNHRTVTTTNILTSAYE